MTINICTVRAQNEIYIPRKKPYPYTPVGGTSVHIHSSFVYDIRTSDHHIGPSLRNSVIYVLGPVLQAAPACWA
jgi:hypothetical protein